MYASVLTLVCLGTTFGSTGLGEERILYRSKAGDFQAIHLTDLEGDGKPEVYGLRERQPAWLRIPSGEWISAGLRESSVTPFDFSVSICRDVDSDGDADVLALQAIQASPLVEEGSKTHAIVFYENMDGCGSFREAGFRAVAMDTRPKLLWKDLNSDGEPDLILIHDNQQFMSWLPGPFPGDPQFPFRKVRLSQEAVLDVLIADVDRDQDLDLFILTRRLDTCTLLENHNGQGAFTAHSAGGSASGWRLTAGSIAISQNQALLLTSQVMTSFAENETKRRIQQLEIHFDGELQLVNPLFQPNAAKVAELKTLELGSARRPFLMIRSDVQHTLSVMGVSPVGLGTEEVLSRRSGWGGWCDTADMDEDGLMDLLCFSSRGSKVSWFPSAPDPKGSRRLATLPSLTSEGPLSPLLNTRKVLPRDMDHDGDMDLVAYQEWPAGLVWLENTSSRIWPARMIYRSDDRALRNPKNWDCADLDEDGSPDLLFVYRVERGFKTIQALSWMRNVPEDRTFAEARILENSPPLILLGHADLNQDGCIDIVGTGSANCPTIHFGIPKRASFEIPISLIECCETNYRALQVDASGDGNPDLLLWGGQRNGSCMAIHGWTREYGYQLLRTFDVAPRLGNLLAVQDLDGNRFPELILASYSKNESLRIIRDFMQAPSLDHLETIGPDSLRFYAAVATDLDLDARPELIACVGHDSLAWSRISGNGIFEPWQLLHAPKEAPALGGERYFGSTAWHGYELSVVDFGGDGREDMLRQGVQERSLTVFRNLGGQLDRGLRLTINSAGARQIQLADLDNDGDLDLLSACRIFPRYTGGDVRSRRTPDRVYTHRIEWHENLGGTGAFAAPEIISTHASGTLHADAGDLDKDGENEVFTLPGGLTARSWYTFDQVRRVFVPDSALLSKLDSTSIHPSSPARFGQLDLMWDMDERNPYCCIIRDHVPPVRAIPCADLDGDGDRDVIALRPHLVWFENDNGTVDESAPRDLDPFSSNSVSQVLCEDLDGDGDLDVVVASSHMERVEWLRNLDGKGNFDWAEIVEDHLPGTSSLAIADMDLDGDPDLVCGSSEKGQILYYENLDGHGVFSSGALLSDNAPGVASLTCGDVDGDGDPDLIAALPETRVVVLYRNNLR